MNDHATKTDNLEEEIIDHTSQTLNQTLDQHTNSLQTADLSSPLEPMEIIPVDFAEQDFRETNVTNNPSNPPQISLVTPESDERSDESFDFSSMTPVSNEEHLGSVHEDEMDEGFIMVANESLDLGHDLQDSQKVLDARANPSSESLITVAVSDVENGIFRVKSCL